MADDVRVLLVGDIHLSDRPPSSCTDSYLEDLFVLLEHTITKAIDLKVQAVVWSGDVFHHKQPSRTSHKTVQRTIAIIQRYREAGIRLLIVPGNHDMLADRFDSIHATQPLGVLFGTGAELLSEWDEGGLPIYGIPWLQRWTQEDVHDAFRAWHSNNLWMPEELPGCLVVTHAPLYPPGMEMEFEFYPTRTMVADKDPLGQVDSSGTKHARAPWNMIQAVGSCYYGHVHEAHGTYTVGDVTFCNQGAITRGSLHESELQRAIAVTLWTPEGGFERVDIPHKPADEVFRLMEKREAEDKQVELDSFLASVGETTLEITSIEAVVRAIREMGLPEDVTQTAIDLLADSKA